MTGSSLTRRQALAAGTAAISWDRLLPDYRQEASPVIQRRERLEREQRDEQLKRQERT